jgi:hypothetical protein
MAVVPLDGYTDSLMSQPLPNSLSLRNGQWTAGTAATP